MSSLLWRTSSSSQKRYLVWFRLASRVKELVVPPLHGHLRQSAPPYDLESATGKMSRRPIHTRRLRLSQNHSEGQIWSLQALIHLRASKKAPEHVCYTFVILLGSIISSFPLWLVFNSCAVSYVPSLPNLQLPLSTSGHAKRLLVGRNRVYIVAMKCEHPPEIGKDRMFYISSVAQPEHEHPILLHRICGKEKNLLYFIFTIWR